ncbi:MAG: SAM-dependent chlorinase/fluorinase [Planctomycetota bacterium]|nr:SAM-dependent chlorinase/fluorinase [Planctomycetota bacterium]
MSASLPPVTLTTDFGRTDHYVAQMKGVILGLAPQAAIVDVTHEIPPQDIRRAAFLIADLAEAFPPGTVHVAVVDPGVGSDRAILAVSAGGQFYIAPDNGLLTLVLQRHGDADVVQIANAAYRRRKVTSTFHGRDVMAPAAAHLLNGLPLRELGERLERSPVQLEGMTPIVCGERIEACVAWIDRFGHLVTNVDAGLIRRIEPGRVRAKLGTHTVSQWRGYYAESPRRTSAAAHRQLRPSRNRRQRRQRGRTIPSRSRNDGHCR